MIASFCSLHRIEFERDFSLKENTTFRIGGPADVAVYPKNADETALLLRYFEENHLRYFVLGRGSDILASDKGYRGIILSTKKMNNLSVSENLISAGAGCSMTSVSNLALKEGLSGLEFLHGIPGSIGGGIYMNAGAYGSELSSFVESVTWVDSEGVVRTSSPENLDFSYRHSYFSNHCGIVCSAVLRGVPGNPDEIREIISDLDGRRREKQPLEYPSAGSAFKRPEGYFAGKLIEDAGLKGFSVGGACVSEKHAGFIVNKGGATSADVHGVIEYVTKTVYRQTGITLEPEIQFLDE